MGSSVASLRDIVILPLASWGRRVRLGESHVARAGVDDLWLSIAIDITNDRDLALNACAYGKFFPAALLSAGFTYRSMPDGPPKETTITSGQPSPVKSAAYSILVLNSVIGAGTNRIEDLTGGFYSPAQNRCRGPATTSSTPSWLKSAAAVPHDWKKSLRRCFLKVCANFLVIAPLKRHISVCCVTKLHATLPANIKSYGAVGPVFCSGSVLRSIVEEGADSVGVEKYLDRVPVIRPKRSIGSFNRERHSWLRPAWDIGRPLRWRRRRRYANEATARGKFVAF